MGDLEAIFQEQLKAFFVDRQQIAQALAEGEAAITQKEELVRVLEAEEGRVQREMRKIYDLYMADKISKDGFGEAYGPLEVRLAEIRKVRKEIPAPRGELDYLKIQHLSSGEIVAEARTLYTTGGKISARRRSEPSWRPSPSASRSVRTRLRSPSSTSRIRVPPRGVQEAGALAEPGPLQLTPLRAETVTTRLRTPRDCRS